VASILYYIKHFIFGFRNIGRIILGADRLTSDELREKIVSGYTPPVSVDEDLCLGCGVCSHICPTKAIEMVEYGAKIELTPGRFKEKVPKIDHVKCVYCLQCHDNCPCFTLHKMPAAIHPRGVEITGVKAQELFTEKEVDDAQETS
jgi:energy-converting hydrogenase B subunit L